MAFARMLINSIRLLCPHCDYQCGNEQRTKIFSLQYDLPEKVECEACHQHFVPPLMAFEAADAFLEWKMR